MADVLIPTTGFDGKPLLIAKRKILGIITHPHNPAHAQVAVASGPGDDWWTIAETVESFRTKYDNA